MKVLGIDPGTAACGYGIVHESGGRLRAEGFGCWRTSARDRPDARLLAIFEGVQQLIAAHLPDAVALEESFVGADARIALSVGQARGAVLVAAAAAGVDCTEYAPARVKQTVWNPDSDRLLAPHVYGWGYALNLYAVGRRLGLLGR